MNPLTNVKNQNKINELELKLGISGEKKSWHDRYKDSAWIFFGNVSYDLTEGDIICIFSQYGEIVNINLIRDRTTGKSKGFGFLCYEDQRSTVLAVDNFNGTKVLGRILRVDHVEEYRLPELKGTEDEVTKKLYEEGCAPQAQHNDLFGGNPDDPFKTHKKKKKKEKRDKTTKNSDKHLSCLSSKDSGFVPIKNEKIKSPARVTNVSQTQPSREKHRGHGHRKRSKDRNSSRSPHRKRRRSRSNS